MIRTKPDQSDSPFYFPEAWECEEDHIAAMGDDHSPARFVSHSERFLSEVMRTWSQTTGAELTYMTLTNYEQDLMFYESCFQRLKSLLNAWNFGATPGLPEAVGGIRNWMITCIVAQLEEFINSSRRIVAEKYAVLQEDSHNLSRMQIMLAEQQVEIGNATKELSIFTKDLTEKAVEVAEQSMKVEAGTRTLTWIILVLTLLSIGFSVYSYMHSNQGA